MSALTRLDPQEFLNFVSKMDLEERFFLRSIYVQSSGRSYTLNAVIDAFDHIQSNSSFRKEDASTVISKIRSLEQKFLNEAQKKGFLTKAVVAVSRRVEHLFYDKNKILERIEFPGREQLTSKGVYRLMVLEGEKGVIACRVRGDSSATVPHLSKNQVMECVTRSFLRLNNLVAVRGDIPGSRMIGPCDYYGNLEAPHAHKYTIHIDTQGVPAFLLSDTGACKVEVNELKPADDFTTKVNVKWHRGTDPQILEVKSKYKTTPGDSLFPNAGLLEVQGEKMILKKMDAREVDLTPFKARLVANDTPFQITTKAVPSSDDYRAVTYLYEPNYAKYQVENGGGLFLETHEFAQTMTPIEQDTKGFVTLAKWVDASHTQLEVIGVEIPYGHTLIIEENCIHGDTNLSGMFMMCMTSNHRTMQTANTVFLKSETSKENTVVEIGGYQTSQVDSPRPYPFARYRDCALEEKSAFNDLLKEQGVVFNPLTRV